MSRDLPPGIEPGSPILISRDPGMKHPVVGWVTDLKTASVEGLAMSGHGFVRFTSLWWAQGQPIQEPAKVKALNNYSNYGVFDLTEGEKQRVMLATKCRELETLLYDLKAEVSNLKKKVAEQATRIPVRAPSVRKPGRPKKTPEPEKTLAELAAAD